MRLWIDGRPVAGAAPLDRGLEFGDGLFETIAVVAGRPRLVERHLARLAAGCGRLGIAPPDAAALAGEVAAAAAVPDAGLVKVVVTRGTGGTGYAAVATPPRRYVLAAAARARPAAWWTDGVAVRRCALRLSEQPALAGLKHLNRLEQVLARREWADPAIAEGLLSDSHGRVVCGTMTNVFLAIGPRLVTPAVTRCGVAGVMRGAVLDALAGEGAAVEVRDVAWDEVAGASEAFLTNALVGAWPVRALDGRSLAPGPWARRVQALVAGW